MNAPSECHKAVDPGEEDAESRPGPSDSPEATAETSFADETLPLSSTSPTAVDEEPQLLAETAMDSSDAETAVAGETSDSKSACCEHDEPQSSQVTPETDESGLEETTTASEEPKITDEAQEVAIDLAVPSTSTSPVDPPPTHCSKPPSNLERIDEGVEMGTPDPQCSHPQSPPPSSTRPSSCSSVEGQSVTLDFHSERSEVEESECDEDPLLLQPSTSGFSPLDLLSASDISCSPLSPLSLRSNSPPTKSAPPIPPPPAPKTSAPALSPPPVAAGSGGGSGSVRRPVHSALEGIQSYVGVPGMGEAPIPRLLQRLTVAPLQFKASTCLHLGPESRVCIQVRLDEDEILHTMPVGGNGTLVFSEKATVELKKHSQQVRLVVVEHMADGAETRQIGKASVRRKDIISVNGTEIVLPVHGFPSSRATVSSVLGEVCLDVRFMQHLDAVVLRVLDYTATVRTPPQRRSSSSSSSSTNSLFPSLSSCNGRLFLAVCITVHGKPLAPMSRLSLQDRRSADSVQFRYRTLSDTYSSLRARHGSNGSSSGASSSNGNSASTTGVGTNAEEASPVRLNIKFYSDPSYDESSYVGFARIPLDSETFMPMEKMEGANWYEIKSRMTVSQGLASPPAVMATSQYDPLDTMPSTSTQTLASAPSSPAEKVGDLRVQFWYSVEHILAFNHYQPLYHALVYSLDAKPYDTSVAALLQHLPIELGHVARPLMKIFIKNNHFTQFFRLVCSQYMATNGETYTLFRNQSMTSKLMHELMKFVGSDYLIAALKPVIDLVYAERKRCEIDPTKLRAGEDLEENVRNLAVYAELAFSRVCESGNQCPQALRSVFAVLREVVEEFYPSKPEISRLAVSSFLIMRFFAAAILNPTQYGLKKKPPEPDVSRTLVLISKILQRLANCAVSQQPLTNKEPWLSRVLERFFDDADRDEMMEFFDAISQPLASPPSTGKKKPEVLKTSVMVERRSGSNRRRSIKDLISQKRRNVTLTNSELCWQKVTKDAANEEKSVMLLGDITSVTQLQDKFTFRVTTPHQEVNFQAGNATEMTDWMVLITTLQRRHLFFRNRSTSQTRIHQNIDMEKELETLHTLLIENVDSLVRWKELVEGYDLHTELSAADKFPQILFQHAHTTEERAKIKKQLVRTLNDTVNAVQAIEDVHQTAMTLAFQMQNLQNLKPSDKMSINSLTDNENYLLMRGRERHLKAKALSTGQSP